MNDLRIWQGLNPGFLIEEEKPLSSVRSYRLDPKEKSEKLQLLKEDGYCYIPSLIKSEKIDAMRSCVQTLLDKGIPPVYCFVYDLFWELILELDPLLTDLLSNDYLTIPNIWTWHVDGNGSG